MQLYCGMGADIMPEKLRLNLSVWFLMSSYSKIFVQLWKHSGWTTTEYIQANPVLLAPTPSTVIASATASTTASSTPQTLTLSIKIVSAKKKSDYAVQNLHLNG